MTRCRQTDALLDVAFGGLDLTRPQADHAAACAECAHALAQLRRFEGELERIGHELAPEPMPVVDWAVLTHESTKGRMTTRRRLMAGGGSAAATLAVLAVVLVGPLDGQNPSDRAPAGNEPPSAVGWAEHVKPAVIRVEAAGTGPDAWMAVRVERCGSMGIVLFEGDNAAGERRYAWGIGPIGGVVTASGLADRVDDAALARLRADLPPCSFELDRVADVVLAEIGTARDLWRLMPGEETFEGFARVIGATSTVDGHRSGPNGEQAIPTYMFILEAQGHDAILVQRPAVSVDRMWTISSNDVLPIAAPRIPSSQVFGDPTLPAETLFAWIDDPRIRAVDLWIARERDVVRFTVDQPGFLVQFDARVGSMDEIRYEFLDETGGVVSSGSVVEWPPPSPQSP